MAIPATQLETWSHQGAVAQSRDTYATIRRALNSDGAQYHGSDCKIFLQGSYGNDTNVYAESDVDMVICLRSTFHYVSTIWRRGNGLPLRARIPVARAIFIRNSRSMYSRHLRPHFLGL